MTSKTTNIYYDVRSFEVINLFILNMTFKIIIYGDKKSGKTSYINRLLYNSFSYKYLHTI
jgi:GTPase SAR1 family protein